MAPRRKTPAAAQRAAGRGTRTPTRNRNARVGSGRAAVPRTNRRPAAAAAGAAAGRAAPGRVQNNQSMQDMDEEQFQPDYEPSDDGQGAPSDNEEAQPDGGGQETDPMENPEGTSTEHDSDIDTIKAAAQNAGIKGDARLAVHAALALTLKNASLRAALKEAQERQAQAIGRPSQPMHSQPASTSDLQRLKTAAELAKFLPKPSAFAGSDRQNYIDWKVEVRTYLAALDLPGKQEVAVVTGLLKGTALKWWCLREKHLVAKVQPMPGSAHDVLEHLDERFDHTNPELAARDALATLRQGSRSVHEYIKAFDDYYSHLTTWDEADKVHKFLFGLNDRNKERFAVNPNTNRRWQNYEGLVAYISSFVADNPLPANSSGTLLGDKPKYNRFQRNRPKLNAIGGVHKKSAQKNMFEFKIDNTKMGNPAKVFTVTGPKGQSAERTGFTKSWCILHKRCMLCYKAGHVAAECRTPNPILGDPQEGLFEEQLARYQEARRAWK